MALFWQLRRIYRQKMRGFAPTKALNYQQIARRRVIVTFAVFFVGWKFFGLSLNDWYLFRKDAVTGEYRFHAPNEVKMIAENAKKRRDPEFVKAEFERSVQESGFTLDSD